MRLFNPTWLKCSYPRALETLSPWLRKSLHFIARSSLSVVITPPSPHWIVLWRLRLNTAMSPNIPVCFPLYKANGAWALSSITKTFFSLANAMIGSMSHGCPQRWTTIIAFVLSVYFRFMSSGSISRESLIVSQNTGTPLEARMASAEAAMVKGGRITSSPGPMPQATTAA